MITLVHNLLLLSNLKCDGWIIMPYELVNVYIDMMIVLWIDVHCFRQQQMYVQKGGGGGIEFLRITSEIVF